jgi:hypothetical protein
MTIWWVKTRFPVELFKRYVAYTVSYPTGTENSGVKRWTERKADHSIRPTLRSENKGSLTSMPSIRLDIVCRHRGRSTVVEVTSWLPMAPLIVQSFQLTKLTNSIERSPWEANNRSARQEIPAFYGNKSSLMCSQEPVTGPCREPDESSPHLYILLLYNLFYF